MADFHDTSANESNEITGTIFANDYPRRHSKQVMSPFRYPGGKGFLAGYLANQIALLNGVRNYVEPYCGGAGAALILLQDGIVDHLYLNDLDVRVYSAWRAMLLETERFVERIRATPVTVDTWKRCREILQNAQMPYDFDLGFATYFLNRTSRSGIVTGSGPIGGYDQSGKWKLDARYYADSMIGRIEWLGQQKDKITLSSRPALAFLRTQSTKLDSNSTFYFIDPPYVGAGSRLYLNAMSLQNHRDLAVLIRSGVLKSWVLTYDDDPLVHQLYSGLRRSNLQVNYSVSNARKDNEVLIHA